MTSPVNYKNDVFDNRDVIPPKNFAQYEAAPTSQREQRILFSEDRKTDWRSKEDELKPNRYHEYQKTGNISYNKELISPL